MTTYRYLFADLLTNQINAELMMTGVNFTKALNSAGTFSGTILITDANQADANIINSTQPGRTAVYVDRDGVLVWGGVIWSREYNSSSQHISISAREFESYFEKRKITTTTVFSNIDQLTIAQTLVNTAQSVTGGNIGVQVGTETSGVLVSRTYFSYEQKTIFAALSNLSQQTNGFDFNIDVAYDGAGNPTKILTMKSPQGGTRYNASDPNAPVFEFPAGNVIEYTMLEDGSTLANKLTVTGAGSNEGLGIQTRTATSQLTAGWALLEDSASYGDIYDQNVLSSLADGKLIAVQNPPVTLQIVAPPWQDPVLGSYEVGDDIRVRIQDDRYPNGNEVTGPAIYRLVSLTVTPGESAGERVTLSLTLPTN